MINTGDTGFILICAALVLLMTPGLAFFYGGMVRRKNVVNTMMTSIFVIGIAMVMWVLFGYSLAFGNDHFGIIGDLSFLGLNGIGLQPGSYADSIPSLEYAAFQMMFAIITPALITGAVAGMLSWMAMDVWMNKKPTLVGSVTGLIVGLVAITPGAGYVPIWSAIIIGLVGSPICYLMISKGKKRFGYDDALDAFGCHGIGGIWGGIATGLFAQTSINSVARWNGLFFGDTQLLVAQIISILVTILVAVAGTLICIAIVRLFTTLRVEKREEQIGLDISQHNETAYPSFNGLD